MAKNKTPQALLQAKEDRLDWERFSLLENLLVFCVMKSRRIPQESGVCFRIHPRIKDEGICLVFKIDRGARDPLIRGDAIKPDFMVMYVTRDRCLLTIIEMKGRDKKRLDHGIDQIKTLRDLLRQEIERHLPTTCKIVIQGLLLTPFNSDIPRARLAKEATAGLIILPVPFDHRADLYSFVTKLNRLTDPVKPADSTSGGGRLVEPQEEFNALEQLLVQGALPVRLEDTFWAQNFVRKRTERDGLYLNLALPQGQADDYTVLWTQRPRAVLATGSRRLRAHLAAELKRLGFVIPDSAPKNRSRSSADADCRLASSRLDLEPLP